MKIKKYTEIEKCIMNIVCFILITFPHTKNLSKSDECRTLIANCDPFKPRSLLFAAFKKGHTVSQCPTNEKTGVLTRTDKCRPDE